MSREVRPVALDWEHPRDGTYPSGEPRYVGLFSRQDLLIQLDWRAEHPDHPDGQEPIDLSRYMPEIPEGTPYGWQLYETISEGSPISPVCKTKEELATWLSSPAAGREQRSPEVAAKFVEVGGAPSFVLGPQGFESGVEWVGR